MGVAKQRNMLGFLANSLARTFHCAPPPNCSAKGKNSLQLFLPYALRTAVPLTWALGSLMQEPKLNESQLADVLDCLYESFFKIHGANTSQLDKHGFYVTDRMSCSKAARLNFMYIAKARDGQHVQMHSSIYHQAISTLVQRGLAQWRPNEPLAFFLTLRGYEQAHNKRAQESTSERLRQDSKWSINRIYNEHPFWFWLIALVVGTLATILAA